jgi:hypothetical protein
MPRGTGSGKRNLVLPAAVAAALPLGVGAALYAALPAAAPEAARARLTTAEPEGEAAPPACREHRQRVLIDGAAVDAFAVLCRDGAAGAWVLAAPPPGQRLIEAGGIAGESAAPPTQPPSVAVVAADRGKPAPRYAGGHARRPAAAPPAHRARPPQRAHRDEWSPAAAQQKYGP